MRKRRRRREREMGDGPERQAGQAVEGI